MFDAMVTGFLCTTMLPVVPSCSLSVLQNPMRIKKNRAATSILLHGVFAKKC